MERTATAPVEVRVSELVVVVVAAGWEGAGVEEDLVGAVSGGSMSISVDAMVGVGYRVRERWGEVCGIVLFFFGIELCQEVRASQSKTSEPCKAE